MGVSPDSLGITKRHIANRHSVCNVIGTYGSDGNAGEEDLRSGMIGYNADGRFEGKLIDHGNVSKTLACGEGYPIEKGIYGLGKITAKDLASQTTPDSGFIAAAAAQILKGFMAFVNGKKIPGSMKNISSDAPITYASNNFTKVVLGDAAFQSKNSDGVERVQIRYNSTPGYITANTIFAVSLDVMARALGIIANKIAKGNTVCGVVGTEPRSEAVSWGKTVSLNCTGYSDTASSRKVSLGVLYSGWDTIIMRFYPTTDYRGPITIALSKGKSMRVPITTLKYSNNTYRNAWVSVDRSSSGEVTLLPFRGNVSGTYNVVCEVVGVLDGKYVADE